MRRLKLFLDAKAANTPPRGISKASRVIFSVLTLLLLSIGQVWGADVIGTINFGSASGSTNINGASVTGDDSKGNTWTVTTAGTTSFTPNASYAQIGSSNKPATSITFTTTLPASQTIKAFSAKFGGFSSTAGTVTLKVGETTVGTGSLNASTDVTVTATTTTASGTVLTVTITGISKGVKAYNISYTYDGGGDPDPVLQSIAVSGTPSTTSYEAGNAFDPAGLVVTGTYDVGDPAAITSNITWMACKTENGTYVALDNEAVALAKDETGIYVKATVSEITSPAFHVTGLTVTAAAPKITITQSSSGVSGSYSSNTFTQGGVTFSYTDWMKSTNFIQAKKSTTGSLKNTTAIPGVIKSITVVTGEGNTARAVTINGGATAGSLSAITAPTTSMSMKFDFGTNEYYFFELNTPGNACYFDKIVIEYEPAPEISSIAIKTAPTKTIYTALENFDPAGLVLTVNYEGGTSKDVTYNDGTKDAFSFSPALDVPLNATHTGNVTVTYGAKTTTQAITVNRIATSLEWSQSEFAVIVGATSPSYPTLTKTPNDLTGVTYSSSNEDVALIDENTGEIVLGETPGSSTITASFAQTDVYAAATNATYTLTLSAATSPYLEVDPTTLNFDVVAVNENKSLDFTLSGSHLDADASLAITGTGASMFSVASSVAKDGEGAILEDVTVTYAPTTAGSHSATLTITSSTASATVALSGTAKVSHAITWSVGGTALSGDALAGVTTSVLDGSGITALPADPNDATLDCANKFIGWSRSNLGTTLGQSAPSDLFTEAANAGDIEGDVTFYAVFATVEGGGVASISFGNASSDSNTDISGTADDVNEAATASGMSYTSGSKVYAGTYGMKIGASGAAGSMTYSVSPSITTKTIKVDAKKYGNDTGTLSVTVNGETSFGSAQSPSADGGELTFTVENAVEVSSVTVATSTKRGYVKSITVGGSATSDYVTECAAVAAPVITLSAATTYNAAQTTEITCATDGASIKYTTDGTEPSKTVGTAYNDAITVDQNMTIKAIAIKGEDASDVVSATYTFQVPAPTISGATAFLESSEVTIEAVEGAAIYYTDDNTEPTTESTLYSEPFTVDATKTIKAIAVKANWNNSEVAEQAFTKVTPLTVAEAISTIGNNTTGIANQYVKGIISQIDSYNSTYNSITYWISDDGTTTNQLEVYSGLAGVAHGGVAFDAADNLKVGEEVIVNGTLKKFSSTYEFDKNNTIVAYRPFAPIAWSKDACTAELGGSSNVFPTLNNAAGLTITYTSSDATKASFADASVYDITLNAVTGETPVTITATSAANEQYVATSVTYALTITEEEITYYSLSYVKNGGTSDVTNSDAETNLPANLPTITKAGYNFGGWYTDSEFEHLAEAGAPLTENTTLYAQWLDPFTVAEALTMINALEDGQTTTESYYVAGVVTNDAVTLESGSSATYYINNTGNSNSLKVFKGKGLNNAAVAEGDILEADSVVLYGQLMKYVKNSTTTPEIVSSYIFSLDRPTTAVTGVTLPATVTVRKESTITLTATIAPGNASDKAVTWASDDTNIVTVDENGVVTGVAEGTAHITVTTEDGGFQATCTVTVAAARPTFTETDHEWIKITTASKLVAGRFYVIASETKGKTAKNTITSNRLDQVASTFEDGRISVTNLGSNTAIFELGGVSGAWTLNEVTNEANTGLLSYNADKKVEWAGTSTTWDISIEDGDATIAAVSASTERILHNNSSSWFTVYASAASTSMLLPQLYMWAELSHAVTFDANGGVAESVPGVERTDEGKIIIPETVPTHSDASKVFAGWYENQAGTGTKYEAGDEFSTSVDATLYAKWSTVPTYTVTYVLGGTGTAPEVTAYPAGRKVTVATVSDIANPGYLFTSWTVKDADNNVLSVDENNQFTMPAANVTITARWEEQQDQKWSLVESNDDLVENAEYVIVYNGENTKKALGSINTNGTHYGTAVDVVITNGKLKGSSAMVTFTLVKGNEGLNYAFQNGSKYLTWSSGNSLDETTTLSDNSSWKINVGDDKIAAIKNVNDNTRVMKYNTGSPRFACYTSGQQGVQLYKKVELVEVDNEHPMSAESVSENDDVVVKTGGTFTVDEDRTLTDLTVKAGGTVVLDKNSANKLTITGTFTISASTDGETSVEFTNALMSNFEADQNAIINYDLTLGNSGSAAQWHAFTVPFPVDAMNGVYDLNDNKLTNEVNYAIMSYHGDVRAQGLYGWKKDRGILQPGVFYLMTVDGERTTYRFKKAAGALVADNEMALSEYPVDEGNESAVDGKDNGWNGVGNPNLFSGYVNFNVQMLNADGTAFSTVTATANRKFSVGTPFFIQAVADGTMSISTTISSSIAARGTSQEIKDVKVNFGNENYTDNLYISAREDALTTYETGKDLVKMTMSSAPSVPQIFGKAYGHKLCIFDAPLANNQAIYDLDLYAPAAGTYSISAQQVEGATLYVTYNGAIVWNLSLGDYELDLTRGTTTGYGLLLVAQPNQMPTGLDTTEGVSGDAVQKILLNGQLYILRDGHLFDAVGHEMK